MLRASSKLSKYKRGFSISSEAMLPAINLASKLQSTHGSNPELTQQIDEAQRDYDATPAGFLELEESKAKRKATILHKMS